jgi:hypothetical protein
MIEKIIPHVTFDSNRDEREGSLPGIDVPDGSAGEDVTDEGLPDEKSGSEVEEELEFEEFKRWLKNLRK